MTATAPLIKIYVDFDADGAFTTSDDDLSAYYKSHSITAGISDELARVADVGRCTIVLNNEDRVFSPLNTGGTYYGKLLPGLPVRVDAVAGVNTYTIFRGVTRSWKPTSGIKPMNCTLTCEDALGQLQAATIAMPLQEDETPKTILEKICATALGGESATGTLTYWDEPANNRAVVVAGRTYTYKTALTGAANEVLIEAAGAGSQYKGAAPLNLANAINGGDGSGTDYDADTVRHSYVTALASPSIGYYASEQDADHNLRETGGYDGLSTALHQTTYDLVTDTLYLYLKKVGTPTGTMTVRVETTAGTTPSGTLWDANATVTLSEAALSTSYGWIAVTFPADIRFPKGMRLHITLTTNRAASGTNYVVWGGKSGTWFYGTLTGATWTYVSSATLLFLVPGLVSLTANAPGTWGNALDLSVAGSEIAESGAALAGGTDEPSGLTDFAAGLSTIQLAGDTWRDGETNALTAIQQIVESEYGLLWVARNGKITFEDRDYEFLRPNATAALTLNDEMAALSGDISLRLVYNRVTADYAERIEETSGVIARANGSIEVKPGLYSRTSAAAAMTINTVTIPFIENTTGQMVGAKNAIIPYPGADYTVTDKEEGYSDSYSGRDYSSDGLVLITMALSGSGVELTFSNSFSQSLWVNNLQVRGVALVTRNKRELTAQDATSIAAYERRDLSVPMPFATNDNETLGQAIADHLLSKYKNPAYRVSEIALNNQYAVGVTSPYAVNLGDVLTVSETQTAVSAAKFLVTGWQNSGSVGRDHAISWSGRLLGALTYWTLANTTYGVLGTTTRLGLGGGNYTGGYADGAIVGVVDFNRALRDDTSDMYYARPNRYTHFHDESIVSAGNAIAYTVNTSQMFNYYGKQTASARWDAFTFSCVLVPGSYSLYAYGVTLSSGGIFKIVMDNTYTISLTNDTYSAAPAYNVEIGFASFTVTEMKRHVFFIQVTDKHASSSGYDLALTAIDIVGNED